MLEQALAAGIISMGVDVVLVGPLPTPGIANLTTSMRADAGAVISASHNPYQDNGIKFFWRDGFKLPDETEAKIEELIVQRAPSTPSAPPRPRSAGPSAWRTPRGRYIVFLKNTFPRELTLEGLTIVVDCANGAAYKTAPAVLEELGAKVITPRRRSRTARTSTTSAARSTRRAWPRRWSKHGADLGIALDGDADRLIVVDEKGKVVDGDAIMAICTGELVARKELEEEDAGRHGDEQHRAWSGAVARWGVKVVRTTRGRPLRRRGDAQERLQPRRRAVAAT